MAASSSTEAPEPPQIDDAFVIESAALLALAACDRLITASSVAAAHCTDATDWEWVHDAASGIRPRVKALVDAIHAASEGSRGAA